MYGWIIKKIVSSTARPFEATAVSMHATGVMHSVTCILRDQALMEYEVQMRE